MGFFDDAGKVWQGGLPQKYFSSGSGGQGAAPRAYDPYAPLATTSKVLDPTTGETPLPDISAPTTENTSTGGPLSDKYNAFNAFRQQFGRNPTQSELTMLTPSFASGGAYTTGPSAVAQYYQSLANTPSNLTANQNKNALEAYKKDQANFDSQINGIFKQSTNRDATDAERQHFGSLLATGEIDPYGLTQLVGQTQEAQQNQTQKYQDTLSKNIQGTQGDYYKNQILPGLESNFTKQGRSFDSSGFQNAAVQAGKQQNYDLQNYLAQFGAGQYGQSASNQQNVYKQYMDSLYGRQNAGIAQIGGFQSDMGKRNQELFDYQTQMNAYNNYLARYGKRSSGASGAIQGAFSGGMTGGMVGGPWGALAGAGAGAGLGYFGSQG